MEGDQSCQAGSRSPPISIHSLRMEGDQSSESSNFDCGIFQSTPSAWRETAVDQNVLRLIRISIHSLRMEGDKKHLFQGHELDISIHSLRMEGDMKDESLCPHHAKISIHSLRMEGDGGIWGCLHEVDYFNPLPPHGGRLFCYTIILHLQIFQSTPSAWRETAKLHRKAFFISPILVQSCKKGCKRLHSAPEKMVFFEKREKNLVRNLQHLSVRL